MNQRPRIDVVEFEERLSQPAELSAAQPIGRAAATLAQGNVVVLRVKQQTVNKQLATERAETVARAVTHALIKDHGLPRESYVELDDESRGTPVAPFHSARFLLPHQDGGHCSFLTPARLDTPDLNCNERVFSQTVYWKRPSHKMFQGFLITSAGDPPGETYYYNTLTLLWDAFIFRHEREAAGIEELARFNLDNLRRSKELQDKHRSRYVTLGALLGATRPEHHVMPSGPRAESDLWPIQYSRLPDLCQMADSCPCGKCRGTGERLFCHASYTTLGRSWPEFRLAYESSVVGQQYDLLMGNNLTQLHAAFSSQSRTIRPICIVIDRPESSEYEHWLANQWRVWFGQFSQIQTDARVS